MKPVVAHLIEKYATTGENYVFEQALLSQRHDYVLLGETDLRTKVRPLPTAKVRTFRPQRASLLERAIGSFQRRVSDRLYLTTFNKFLTQELRKVRPQLVHAHFGMMGYKCLPAVRALKLPLIVTFYGVDVSHGVISPYWRPRLQEMFPEAKKIIVLCEEARERLVAIGCPAEKITVWDIGISLTDYPYRAPMPKVQEGVRFLIVARFVEKKGHAHLLPAFKRLLGKHPKATLTIMGNGPLKAQIQAQIARLELSESVTLVDTQGMADFFPQFQTALRTHDIFVLPSVVAKDGDDEGGPPVVITNALAVGLPVISTNVGGIPRAITDGVSGLLAKAEDSDSLYEKMLWLSENPSEWLRLSKAARARAEERFELSRQIQKLEDLYVEVLRSS